MKRNTSSLKAGLLLIGLSALFATQACKKNSGNTVSKSPTTGASKNGLTTMASNADLIAYKATKHEISAGFYRVQGPCYGPGVNGSNFSFGTLR